MMGEMSLFSLRLHSALLTTKGDLTPDARLLMTGIHFRDKVLAAETVCVLVIGFTGVSMIASDYRSTAPTTITI